MRLAPVCSPPNATTAQRDAIVTDRQNARLMHLALCPHYIIWRIYRNSGAKTSVIVLKSLMTT